MKNVKVGDKYSRHSYGTVVGKDYHSLRVRNEDGLEWDISTKIFEDEFNLASTFDSEESESRTKIIQIIEENQRLVMTVNFNKQVTEAKFSEKLEGFIKGGLYDKSVRGADGKWTNRKKALKELSQELLTGENRTLVGRHYGGKDEHGRIKFIDMEVSQPRVVDPRTIKWVIVNNVKYSVKK